MGHTGPHRSGCSRRVVPLGGGRRPPLHAAAPAPRTPTFVPGPDHHQSRPRAVPVAPLQPARAQHCLKMKAAAQASCSTSGSSSCRAGRRVPLHGAREAGPHPPSALPRRGGGASEPTVARRDVSQAEESGSAALVEQLKRSAVSGLTATALMLNAFAPALAVEEAFDTSARGDLHGGSAPLCIGSWDGRRGCRACRECRLQTMSAMTAMPPSHLFGGNAYMCVCVMHAPRRVIISGRTPRGGGRASPLCSVDVAGERGASSTAAPANRDANWPSAFCT